MASPRIIYDLGAHLGDNIPSYLRKADRVIAVEADPELCGELRSRFERECKIDRVVVENRVLLAAGEPRVVDFWVHRRSRFLSQFPRPSDQQQSKFDCVRLQGESITDIIARHGFPFYVKCDLERFDEPILRAMFEAGIVPPYISAECHDPRVVSALIDMGYGAFKLIDGASVHRRYRNRRFAEWPTGSSQVWSFPPHSAGPFGDDVDGPWLPTMCLLARLGVEGVGWKDVHATTMERVEPLAASPLSTSLAAIARAVGARLMRRLRSALSKAARYKRGTRERGYRGTLMRCTVS